VDIFFEFERLDVYQAALEYQLLADHIADSLPSGRSYLRTQILKCGNSMPANIAEGTGERGRERARFYRIARREGLESASHLNSWTKLGLSEPSLILEGRELLHRIVSLLTPMVLRAVREGNAKRVG
jgi:four helix bundle protein